MKLIVFSNHDKLHSEIKHVIQLFNNGLEIFHLRKPNFSSKEITEYLDLIPVEFHNKIVLHSHHKLAKKFKLKGLHFSSIHRKKKYASKFKFFLFKLKHPTLIITRTCHRIHKLEETPNRYTHVFLSPMYESISKKAHGGIFNDRQLKRVLSQKLYNVYAFGGVDESKFEELNEYGFTGVALLGTIWNSEKTPLEVFLSAQNKLEQLNQK